MSILVKDVIDEHQRALIGRLFSPTVARDLADRRQSSLFARAAASCMVLREACESFLVRDVFETAFALIAQSGFRNEYVYRSVIARRILLGKHNLNTATMIGEFRVGPNRADIVVLNGTSTVYEIKSEKDTLLRLSRQLESYQKVFSAVYVVCADKHIANTLAKSPSDVGVLSVNRRCNLVTHRPATTSTSALSPISILDTLRIDEAKKVFSYLGLEWPKVANTILRTEIRDIFSKTKPDEAHDAMLQVLKNTRRSSSKDDFVRSVPNSLRAAVLSANLNRVQRANFISALETPFGNALKWS